jgi:hypothetical protein
MECLLNFSSSTGLTDILRDGTIYSDILHVGADSLTYLVLPKSSFYLIPAAVGIVTFQGVSSWSGLGTQTAYQSL